LVDENKNLNNIYDFEIREDESLDDISLNTIHTNSINEEDEFFDL
jgi:hypothetical protein